MNEVTLCKNCKTIFIDINSLELVWLKKTPHENGHYVSRADAPSWSIRSMCPKCGGTITLPIETRLKEINQSPVKMDTLEKKELKKLLSKWRKEHDKI